MPEGKTLHSWKEDGCNVVYFNGILMPRLLRFALWKAYGLATLPQQTIAIHTSVIQYKGKAVLFVGESGTGKSTHVTIRFMTASVKRLALLSGQTRVVKSCMVVQTEESKTIPDSIAQKVGSVNVTIHSFGK